MPSNDHLDKVKKLREITGVGFKDCNIAIKDCKGDINKSIEYLRVKGISKASKKMERVAKDGLICLYEEKDEASIIEINCETDFVAKNSEFIKFCENLSKISLKEKGKLENINKIKMEDGNSVNDNLVRLISKIGEKITIRRSLYFKNEKCKNFTYMHTSLKKNIGKLGVIVSINLKNSDDKTKEFGNKLAMHIAASNPLAIDIDYLDKNILNNEEKIIKEELKNSGKEPKIVEKILLGRIEKFKQDNCLLTQPWIMEPKKKVKEVIKELGKENTLIIKDFVRYKVGE